MTYRYAPLVAVALCAAAADAAAQSGRPIALRAVDQSSLSRVSFPLGDLSFAFEEVADRQFDVVLPGASVRFDTTQIFPDRLASRVISARTIRGEGETRLRFVLNCDCEADTKLLNGLLVIEFEDPEDDQADGTEAEEEADRAETDRAGTDGGVTPADADLNAETSADLAAAALEGDLPAGLPASTLAPVAGDGAATAARPAGPRPLAPAQAPFPVSKTLPGAEPEPLPLDVRDPGPPAIETAELPATDEEQEIRLARRKLLEQLTRAAEQGLLEFDASQAVSPPPEAEVGAANPDPASGEAGEAAEAPGAEDGELAFQGPVELPIRSRTAIDRDFIDDRSDTIVKVDDCRIEDTLAGFEWPDPKEPGTRMGELRGQLLGEFDKPRPEILEELSLLYLSLGFGAEARQILRLYGEDLASTPLLLDLADVIDGRTPSAEGPLRRSGPCSGLTAVLLAVSGDGNHERLQDADMKAEMLDAFMLMPVKIRSLFGSRLLSHSIDQRDLEQARKIDQLLQRMPGQTGNAHDLALARLIALNGNHEAAEAIYNRVAQTRSIEADEALLLLIDSLIRRDATIPDHLLDRLAYTAYVGRTTEMGTALKLAEIQARAGSGELPVLLGELEEMLVREPDDAAELRDLGHALLEETGPEGLEPEDYVRSVVAYADQIAETAAGDGARARITEELTKLGLANLALRIAAPGLARTSPALRLASARAYMAQGAFIAAMAAVEDLETPDAMALKIEILERSEAPQQALELLEATAAPVETDLADLAWKAGEWDRATGDGPAPRRLLAAFMAGEESAGDGIDSEVERDFLTPPEVPAEITLKDSKAVLGSSKAARSVIEEALNDG